MNEVIIGLRAKCLSRSLRCVVPLSLCLCMLGALLAAVAPSSAAPVIETWVQRYHNNVDGDDEATAVTIDSRGNVVVTGTSAGDFLTIKYASTNGSVLWTNRYNSPVQFSDDGGLAVACDANDNVAVTGYSRGTSGYRDCYTAKYAAANGALLWERRRLQGAGQAVAVDRSGNVVVAGYSSNVAYTAKYAATNGAPLWEKWNPGRGIYWAVAIDGNDNVVVTGSGDLGEQGCTAKYAGTNGALIWERSREPTERQVSYTALAVDANGNVVIASSCNSTNFGPDLYTAKYAAANGAILWEKRYDGTGHARDYANGVAVDSKGNVLVTGASEHGAPCCDSDCYTAKYAAADGALLWEHRYDTPGPFHAFGYSVAVDRDDNVVVTGIDGAGGGAGSFYTAKYDGVDGSLRWEQHYSGPVGPIVSEEQMSSRYSLALSANGMIAVTGSSPGSGTGLDYATVVYREPLLPVGLVPDGHGGFYIQFTGTPNVIYRVLRAASLSGPWDTLATLSAPAPGQLEYHDTTPPLGQAFYRTAQP